MTRRMKANARYKENKIHGTEHDETAGCAYATPCEPVVVAGRMKGNPGGSVYHRDEHDEEIWCEAPHNKCEPVTDIGDHLVVGGVVHQVRVIGRTSGYINEGDIFTVVVNPPPKPAFFEEGKTYTSRGQAFKVETVRDDVAFGYLTGGLYGDRWTTRNGGDWHDFDWTEKA